MVGYEGSGLADSQSFRVIVDDGDEETITVDPITGTVTEKQPDGGVIVRLDAKQAGLGKAEDEDWFRNLIDDLDGTKLSVIINDLIDGIKADDQSRQGWLANTTRGLDLTGLKLESPSADVQTTGDGPVMSKVKAPLLLEACLKGWANAEAELLPANGPVKVKSDGRETATEDDQADLLELAVNRYLTVTATEYYPETSHMLLWGTYFRGSGFKKVYRCPRRRRPVSEKVESKDLIVSDASTDFKSCGRITHEIEMRPSVFKLMQLIGAYRKTGNTQPNPTPNTVDEKIAAIQGTEATPSRPEDKPYTIWETQCELDLDDFIPAKSKFKGQGIPLPYLVSIDKDVEEALSIRRDWQEDDEWCSRNRMYVKYPYVPGPGFYGTGMLNILGNSSAAMTAAWREALDAGMFASFPGGVIDKKAVRGNQGGNANTTFTMGPGEFQPIDTGGLPINQVIAPSPYKDVTPGLMAMMDKITEQSKALGQGAEIPAAEGIANVPVGTMLAQIEQATKIMAAAHKGMHTAQSEEIQMLVDLFRKHPEDLIKSDGDSPIGDWTSNQLVQALNNIKLVPVSDPNVPSHIHRVAKALGLIQLLPIFPQELDRMEVLRRILAAIREDPTGLVVQPQPQTMPPNPADMGKLLDGQAKLIKAQSEAQLAPQEQALKQQELQTERDIHATDTAKEALIHGADQQKVQADIVKGRGELALKNKQVEQDHTHERWKQGLEMVKAGLGAHEAAQTHELNVANHVKDASLEAHKAVLDTHQVLNPPAPSKPTKPKGNK